MRNILIVSFDLRAPDEPTISLSVASLVAYAKASPAHGTAFHLDHIAFDLAGQPDLSAYDVLLRILQEHDLSRLHTIALSAYVWSESLVNPVISLLRSEGYGGRILLGGYQIHYSDTVERAYPDAQVFIKGYAESSFLKAISDPEPRTPWILDLEPAFDSLPSPYLTGELPVKQGQGKVRLETKRGCPYRCAFCAHRDLQRNKVYKHRSQRVTEELALFRTRGVRKVNVVDPVFNMGSEYLEVLQTIVDASARYTIALQTRFENIRDSRGDRFIELCGQLDACLEFGLQSTNPEECEAVNRRNNLSHIDNVLATLNRRQIRYEVSLIYGLPGQTIQSFQRSVDYLRTRGCEVVKAYPLMLLRGTELWDQREKWGFREQPKGPYKIPVVVSSNSFDEQEWNDMRALAETLAPTDRF